MGVSETKESFEADYEVEERQNHPFFRQHAILTHRQDKHQLLRKEFMLPRQQAKHLKKEFQLQQKAAFSLATPTKIISNEEKDCYCSQSYQISIYIQWLEKTLEDQVIKEGKLDNAKALFLLGELSKGLHFMEERGRPHYSIAPNTVFINAYENHFLYDSLYVIGLDPSSFLQSRLKNKGKHRCPLTHSSHRIISKLQDYGLEEALKQDMYDFGLTMLFAITSYKLERLPKAPEDREKKLRMLLDSCLGTYDSHLLGAISRMLSLTGHKSITNHQLRQILDETEIQSRIIKAETRAHSLKQSVASERVLGKSSANNSPEKPATQLTGPWTRLSLSQVSSSRNDSLAFGVMSGSTIGPYKKDQRLCYSHAESSFSSFYQPWGEPKFKPKEKNKPKGVVIYQKIEQKDSQNWEDSEIKNGKEQYVMRH